MELARGGREGAALCVALLVGAAALDEPFLVVGAAGIAAWLLARQGRFVAEAAAAVGAVDVAQEPARSFVATDDEVAVTLSAALPEPSPLRIEVEARPPVAATGATPAERSVTLAPGRREASTTFRVAVPVAGRHGFEPARLTLGDGLFRAGRDAGPAPTLTVEPRTPREVHVGQGGERVAGAFGGHRTGNRGPGLEPAEIRRYLPGDPSGDIDWKATARLAEPYVREFEVETDLRTALIVDHRASMGRGPEGATKLDFAREVALSFVAALHRHGDAAGLYCVGDGGTTVREPPASEPGHYDRLRSLLHGLEPTAAAGAGPDPGGDPGRERDSPGTREPAAVRRAARLLAADDSRFGATLRPYYEDRGAYVRRIASNPLYETVSAELGSLRGRVVTVLVTDDSRRAEVREAVRLASRRGDRALAFLLPTALFEPGGLADLDGAYDRYVAFEEFRRDLARRERVSAFEVAPPDRIEAVLAAARRGRSSP